MIKIGSKIFMITSLFCLRQHFSVMTSLIFIQNFGDYSFVCIYWTVYFLRIHYHSFESYLVVLSKNQKIMASFPFIFCWSKPNFLIIIEIFLKNIFPLVFEPLIPWTWLTPHFFSFLKDLHTDNHRWPINTPKTSNGVEWCHMTYFSWNRWKTAYVSKNIAWKVVKCIIFKNNNSFPMKGCSSKSDEWFRNWSYFIVGDEKDDVSKKFQP